MDKERSKRVCPVERAGGLDNPVRKLLQNPGKILRPYIKPGMTVLDLGCGPGFFPIEIADLLNHTGKVIAADLQKGMLDKVRQKIKGTVFEQRILLHKCLTNSINLVHQVDFVVAFYMAHEVPDHSNLFMELKSILKPGGKILIVEPKFHVSARDFDSMIHLARGLGLNPEAGPPVFFSRTIVLRHQE